MSKNKNVFNPEFMFEIDETNGSNQEKQIQKPIKRSKANVREENHDDNDDEEFSKNNDIELLADKKDLVRIKAQSAKKLKIDENSFFEMPAVDPKKSEIESSFDEMNLSKPLIKALANMGMTEPTKIQKAAIPTALMGKDICACAVTGSGKTLAFMLPTIERLLYKPKFPQVTRVLVLTPTRELAVQICKVTRDLTQFTNVNTCLCAGGFDIKAQEAALRLGPDICIATPGRLIDHLHNTPCFNLETVEIVILDEADRMLDEHFAEQLKEVMRLCSKTHQTMLFSATMTDRVEDLIRMSLKRPVKIFINENMDVTPLLKQEFVRLRDTSERNREAILGALIQRKFNERVIVFVKTKQDCHRLCLLLNLMDIQAAELHGGLTQTQRLEKLNSFKEDTLNVLVATDLAARGLDIENVKTVINFSMPLTFKHYIHRVGRTARAKNSGRAISLVGEDDRWLVKEIVKSSKEPVKCRVIPPEVIETYREKVDNLRIELVNELKKEKDDKLIDKMEKEINHAKNSIKPSSKSSKKTSTSLLSNKRTWLENVDYKTGKIKTKNKPLSSSTDKKSSSKNKPKFLSKFHREQNDNIFSNKFKQNKIKSNKKN